VRVCVWTVTLWLLLVQFAADRFESCARMCVCICCVCMCVCVCVWAVTLWLGSFNLPKIDENRKRACVCARKYVCVYDFCMYVCGP